MKRESAAAKKARLKEVIAVLREEYPDARCTLDYTTPHELLVAAILAAQCTDERVNEITPDLFSKYANVQAFADADYAELEEAVRPTGFFRNKTKAIIQSAQEIVSEFNSSVPDEIDQLVRLSGVGRKTANLIVGDAYGKPAVIVDTHVKRVSARLGFTKEKDPTKIEFDLLKLLEPEDSTHFNHLIVAHGRAVCKAPKPRCSMCNIVDLCPYGQDQPSLRLEN